ncbi:MAG: hypothetical protein ISR65_14395 [Bacteriovoracaceae bacterium]|nr:hypothetical protein [Bacteriovoracaceae bacterium]
MQEVIKSSLFGLITLLLVIMTSCSTVEDGADQKNVKRPILEEQTGPTGNLYVQSSPPNATIWINKEKIRPRTVSQGALQVPLALGSNKPWEIVVQAKGHKQSVPQTVTMEEGEDKYLFFKLDPKKARLHLKTKPPGFKFTINNKITGVTNKSLILPQGVYDIVIELKKNKLRKKTIILGPGERKKLFLNLKQEETSIFKSAKRVKSVWPGPFFNFGIVFSGAHVENPPGKGSSSTLGLELGINHKYSGFMLGIGYNSKTNKVTENDELKETYDRDHKYLVLKKGFPFYFLRYATTLGASIGLGTAKYNLFELEPSIRSSLFFIGGYVTFMDMINFEIRHESTTKTFQAPYADNTKLTGTYFGISIGFYL